MCIEYVQAGIDETDMAAVSEDRASAGVEVVVQSLSNMEQSSDAVLSDSPSKKKKKKNKKKNSGVDVETTEESLGKHGHTMDISSDSPPKKKKKSSGGDAVKTALQTLNELMPGLQYNCISQTGPVHQPTFTVHVDVNGQVCHIVTT